MIFTRGKCPSIMRNCLPETLVAIRNVRFLEFNRTPKPHKTRSRRMRPSDAAARRSRDSLISTITAYSPGQNEDKTLLFGRALIVLTTAALRTVADADRALPRCRHSVRWCL